MKKRKRLKLKPGVRITLTPGALAGDEGKGTYVVKELLKSGLVKLTTGPHVHPDWCRRK